jgi:hypothetical protein
MSLKDLMDLSVSKNSVKVGISDARIQAVLPILRQ